MRAVSAVASIGEWVLTRWWYRHKPSGVGGARLAGWPAVVGRSTYAVDVVDVVAPASPAPREPADRGRGARPGSPSRVGDLVGVDREVLVSRSTTGVTLMTAPGARSRSATARRWRDRRGHGHQDPVHADHRCPDRRREPLTAARPCERGGATPGTAVARRSSTGGHPAAGWLGPRSWRSRAYLGGRPARRPPWRGGPVEVVGVAERGQVGGDRVGRRLVERGCVGGAGDRGDPCWCRRGGPRPTPRARRRPCAALLGGSFGLEPGAGPRRCTHCRIRCSDSLRSERLELDIDPRRGLIGVERDGLARRPGGPSTPAAAPPITRPHSRGNRSRTSSACPVIARRGAGLGHLQRGGELGDRDHIADPR